jgi:S1-C subfamily serine protease
MELLTNLITIILGTYLAFTNTLATQIALVLPDTRNTRTEQEYSSKNPIVTISSESRFESIPDILLRNAEYQRAAVVDSIDPATAPATALEALVNILCTYKTDTYTKTTTGTGFFIDTDGVILTNAHVAQFLLLEGIPGTGESSCIIRTGNPAKPLYEAALLYISPAWILEHANLINDAAPKGTGERDYALLYVTSGLDNKPMPVSFATLPFDTTLLTTGTVDAEVFATGYPAESMLREGVDTPLVPKQATTTIGELMTFGSNLVDLFTIKGTAIGEHGSSGGPVVNKEGKAIGIISTKGDDEEFGPGSLRAISLAYINRTIEEETGFPLIHNLGGNLPYRAELFKDTIVPFLQKALVKEL